MEGINATEPLFLDTPKSYFIYDAAGKLLIAGEGELVDVSRLQEGVFTIEIFSDGEKIVQKFMKETVEKTNLNKNIVHVTSYTAGLAGGGSISYERILHQLDGNITISTFGRLAIGTSSSWMQSKVTFSIAQIGFLTGKRRHHLECGAGIRSNFTDKSGHPFAGNIGWRVQKPEKHFVFRMGVGVPELLYLGLGLSF